MKHLSPNSDNTEDNGEKKLMNKLILALALLLVPVSTALAQPINLGLMVEPHQQQQPNLTLQPTPTDYC